jgi:putative transposase
VNSVTEMNMPLWPGEYKRLVSGEEGSEGVAGTRHGRSTCRASRRGAPTFRTTSRTTKRLLRTCAVEQFRVSGGDSSSTQPEFDAAVVHSYLLGHSTRKSKRFFTEFLGELGVSHTKVSRILARLDERCKAWRSRPIDKPFVYLWLDAKYARIQGADKRPYAVLFAYAATENGDRELLGFQIHRSEGTAHWECMLNDLVNRGLDARNLKLVIRDDNSGCNDAVLSILGDVAQQACAVHLERNIADMVHKEHRAEFQPMVSEIFKQSSEAQARKRLTEVFDRWESVEPKACLALRRRVDASLVFYHIASDGRWRSHLKSTNMLERFFRELKRFEKSRQFRFANKRSCERFYYAFAYDYNQRYPRMPRPSVTQRC